MVAWHCAHPDQSVPKWLPSCPIFVPYLYPTRLPFTEFKEYLVTKDLLYSAEDVEKEPDVFARLKREGYTWTVNSDNSVSAKNDYFKEQSIKRAITDKNLRPNFSYRSDCPAFLRTLVMECWNANPSLRPSFDSIVAILEEQLGAGVRAEQLPMAEPSMPIEIEEIKEVEPVVTPSEAFSRYAKLSESDFKSAVSDLMASNTLTLPAQFDYHDHFLSIDTTNSYKCSISFCLSQNSPSPWQWWNFL